MHRVKCLMNKGPRRVLQGLYRPGRGFIVERSLRARLVRSRVGRAGGILALATGLDLVLQDASARWAPTSVDLPNARGLVRYPSGVTMIHSEGPGVPGRRDGGNARKVGLAMTSIPGRLTHAPDRGAVPGWRLLSRPLRMLSAPLAVVLSGQPHTRCLNVEEHMEYCGQLAIPTCARSCGEHVSVRMYRQSDQRRYRCAGRNSEGFGGHISRGLDGAIARLVRRRPSAMAQRRRDWQRCSPTMPSTRAI